MAATTIERCPWCGSEITHAKFLQVQAAIREDERKKLAVAEKALRATLEKEIAAQQQRFQKERKALDAERAKLSKQIEAAKQEVERQKKKEIADIRQILQKDTETKLLKKDAEFSREREALQKRIS
jgi:Skp family chaperone for outer membrane proteins